MAKHFKMICVIINCGNEAEEKKWTGVFDFLGVEVHSFLLRYDLTKKEHQLGIKEINKGKWRNIKRCIDSFEKANYVYDYYWFPDPDIVMTRADISKLFSFVEEHNIVLGQPSVAGEFSHKFLGKATGWAMRVVDFVECMMPIFSRAELLKHLWTFDLTYSGYGIDVLWGQSSECCVIDAVQAVHPNKPCFEEKAKRLGWPDPVSEYNMIHEKYGIPAIEALHG